MNKICLDVYCEKIEIAHKARTETIRKHKRHRLIINGDGIVECLNHKSKKAEQPILDYLSMSALAGTEAEGIYVPFCVILGYNIRQVIHVNDITARNFSFHECFVQQLLPRLATHYKRTDLEDETAEDEGLQVSLYKLIETARKLKHLTDVDTFNPTLRSNCFN